MSRRPGDRILYRARPVDHRIRKPRMRIAADVTTPDVEEPGVARFVRYGGTLAALILATAALWPLRETIGLLNIGLVYLVVVIGVTVVAGQRAGILASILGFALFDYFLVPPYLTFAIGDLRNILALFVFLGVSLLLSWLIAGAREQAREAQRRAEDVSRLYELSQAIIGARGTDDVLPAIARKVVEDFDVQACWILLPDRQQQLTVRAKAPENARQPTRDEQSLASWAFWHGRDIGQGGLPVASGEWLVASRGLASQGAEALTTSHSPLATRSRSAFVPLQAARRTIGVLGVADKKSNKPFTAGERTVLATFAGQAAVALERLYLLSEAERAETLARTDELKSALMSAVSHDLRTPLASIMASVTSLLDPDIKWDDVTHDEFLQGIYDEARRLNRLVGNLLDMSRIEGGALHPEKDWYAIGEIISGVVQRLERKVSDHPIKVETDPDLPLALLDFTEIDQVITNLLENAFKYTPPGTPIHVRARRAGDNLEVSVEDTGPGVPGEHLPHLFDKFYQVDQRKQKKGAGLGLAISKGLVEAHGGRIWASNRQGGGLKVTFTIPLTPDHA